MLSATKSQNAAKAQHVLNEGYGVPEVFQDFGYGVGKAYREMNKYEKVLFWLFMFGMGGVVADSTLNDGKAVKYTKEKVKSLGDIYKGIVKGTAAGVVVADSPQPPLSNLPLVNASAVEEHHFSPDIKIVGSPEYEQKIRDGLAVIEKTNMTTYNTVMQYLEMVREKPDSTVGKGVFTFPLYPQDNSVTIASGLWHDTWHVLQGMEPMKSQFDGKSTWYDELDAVKVQVDFEAEVYNRTEDNEWKHKRIKDYMKSYEKGFPTEYAQFISEN
ncbi:MAG: hypothetical protein OIN66_18210 [Candidatus Methanoperedens sp.]|nr:hypothetical protein [Candidatus Methanoperedens sp.]